MGLVISRANSIHFVKSDSENQNIENTLSYNEKYASFRIGTYCQKFDDGDTVTVQCVSDDITLPTVTVYAYGEIGTLTPTLKTSYISASRYYFEFEVDMSNYNSYQYIQIKVEQGSDTWWSERVQSKDLSEDLADGYILKLEYTNKDSPSSLPNIQIDYTTDIEFFLYVEAIVKDSKHDGEDEVFEDVDTKKLLESSLYKAREFKTSLIPEFMTDKVAIAGKHFVFLVNGLEYVVDGVPDTENKDSNLKELSMTIIHKSVLGFSTDDKGMEGDGVEWTKTKKDETVTSSWSFVVDAGYILHVIQAKHTNSSGATEAAIKAGYTPGGDDIIKEWIIYDGDYPVSYLLHEQIDFDNDKTVYIEILPTAGAAGAELHIQAQLIYNANT